MAFLVDTETHVTEGTSTFGDGTLVLDKHNSGLSSSRSDALPKHLLVEYGDHNDAKRIFAIELPTQAMTQGGQQEILYRDNTLKVLNLLAKTTLYLMLLFLSLLLSRLKFVQLESGNLVLGIGRIEVRSVGFGNLSQLSLAIR